MKRTRSAPQAHRLLAGLLVVAGLLAVADGSRLHAEPEAPTGTLRLRVREAGAEMTAPVLPCRVHLADPGGKPVRAPGLPFFHDHFNCDGAVDLALPPGTYAYTVARGPEYREVSGEARVESGRAIDVAVALRRWIDMAARGWWSGETHYHRPLDATGLLLRSEDLHFVPVLTQWNQRNIWQDQPLPANRLVQAGPDRCYHVLGSEDERGGGALMYFHLTRPLTLRGDRQEVPSSIVHLREARTQPDVWIDVEKPFWWDVPMWVSTGEVDTIGVANNHMCRGGMLENEAWGRPRDVERFPAPRGNGFYTQELYYRLLDCGFRIPPSAGSASGVLPNPVGYNRVYVHLAGPFSYDAWRRGLLAGRSFVTNGPMLLVEANGRRPGEVFRAEAGRTLSVTLDVRVDGNDPLASIEVIRDGKVVQRLTGGELRGWQRPAPLVFDASGWFLVRAVTNLQHTFRFASSAPFYVEVGPDPMRVDREDVQFFIAWIDERIARLRAGRSRGRLVQKIMDPAALEAAIAPQKKARKVFERRLLRAR